jgi:5-methylcytosine-specific restriction enzyme B
VTPIERGDNKRVSLTKHYKMDELPAEIGQLQAGMTREQVASSLSQPELADDLFVFDGNQLVDDVLVRACQQGDREAPLLLWIALLLADTRLQEIVTHDMTLSSGRLDPSKFSGDAVRKIADARVGGASAGKAASNILRWFETTGIATGKRYGSSIVALAEERPTAFAVPAILQLLEERLAPLGITPTTGPDGIVDLALGFGVNHWVNLTRRDFRAAAKGQAPLVVATKTSRVKRPTDLDRLHLELHRKRQAILQGPPGTGKTYSARRYLKWFTADRQDESRLTSIALTLPESERTPERIADQVQTLGLPGVWEIAQFHPSYSYERFVRGLQSTPVPGGVSFTAVNRVLGTLAAVGRALAGRGDSAELLLMVDEINRGDIAKVFGELLYALEYRDEPVTTPYAIAGDPTLVLPANLLLLGTMNTADQSIAMVDKALRRRFAWLTLRPDPAVLASAGLFAGTRDRQAALWLFEAVAALFDPSDADLGRLQLGHSYFLPETTPSDEQAGLSVVARRFAVDAWPLLEEYEAEGLIDPDQLNALLKSVGWTATDRPSDQTELAEKVAAKLEQVTQPPAVPAAAPDASSTSGSAS